MRNDDTLLGQDVSCQSGAVDEAPHPSPSRLSSHLKEGLLDLSVEAAFVCDDRFCFQYINAAAERLTGYSASELKGKPVDILIPADLRAGHRAKMASFGKDGVLARGMLDRRPIKCLHRDGAEIKVSATVTIIPADGQTYYGVLMHDQTEHEALLGMLEKNRRELALALEKAQLAISARSHFLGKASHELRTPLNAILGFSQLLQSWDSQSPCSEDKVQEYSRIIEESGERLLKIVNQILEFSELSSDHKPLTRQVTPLDELLKSVHASHAEAASAAGVALLITSGCSCDVDIDYPRLRHALANLVDNAVRFTEAGGTVTLRHDHDRKGQPRIHVSDTGIGISSDRLSKITSPFEQCESDPRKASDGIGLGLSTSKAVVALHGGRMRISSRPGQGTTVSITLPASAVRPGPAEAETKTCECRHSDDEVFYI